MEDEQMNYYRRYTVEAVEMAKRIWGEENLRITAEITAFFYRMRAGEKPGSTFEEDILKEKWWLNKAIKSKVVQEITQSTEVTKGLTL